MIEFIEDSEFGYKHRTFENVRLSDLTIAFAVEPDSSGEKTTKNAAKKYNKPFLMVDLSKDLDIKDLYLKNIDTKNIHSLNIAGNGISRFHKYRYTQSYCDELIFKLIKTFIEINNLEISSIRSGGQTGADESGLKAAEKLGIPAICLFPKTWRFRTDSGDISNEKLFKKRFNC